MEYGVGWGCCGIVGENGCWWVRGVINVRVRTLIISKFPMSLVKKCHCKNLIIQIFQYIWSKIRIKSDVVNAMATADVVPTATSAAAVATAAVTATTATDATAAANGADIAL